MVWFTPHTHMLPSLFCLILIPLKIYCTAIHGVLQSENLLKLFLPSLQGRACAPSVLWYISLVSHTKNYLNIFIYVNTWCLSVFV